MKYYSYYSNIIYINRNEEECPTILIAPNKKEALKVRKIFPELVVGERVKGAFHLYSNQKMKEQIELMKQLFKDKKIYFKNEVNEEC